MLININPLLFIVSYNIDYAKLKLIFGSMNYFFKKIKVYLCDNKKNTNNALNIKKSKKRININFESKIIKKF